MTQRQALQDLLAKIEAGDVTGSDCCIASVMGWFAHSEHDIMRAFHGSLDAAKALHEAVLPGFWWQRQGFVMSVTDDHTGWGNGTYCRHRDDENPARAWLICIIKALIAEAEHKTP